MKKGFVFGKFIPFHQGHEAMMRYALGRCDQLTVLVCESTKEPMPGALRKQWIEETLCTVESNVDVRLFVYDENELPNSGESSRAISKIWSDAFMRLLPGVDLLVTSEPYGEYVAEYMGIEHHAFDVDRTIVPVSATAIRNDPSSNWTFIPQAVRPYFCKTIAILGTESTGKSTMAKMLADHFNASLVMEAGRDLIAHSDLCSYEDLSIVALEHAKRIERAVRGEAPIVIIDTDINITMSYSRFLFGRDLVTEPAWTAATERSLHLYLNAEVPMIQDGTRLSIEQRSQLDGSHRRLLKERGVAISEVRGKDWGDRDRQALDLVNAYLASPTIVFDR